VVGVVCLATGVVAVASLRSHRFNEKHGGGAQRGSTPQSEGEGTSITLRQALLFPVFASISLLVMYLCFSFLQHALFIYMMLAAGTATAFVLSPLFTRCERSRSSGRRRHDLATYVSAAGVSIAIIVIWAWTGSAVLNDVIGVALCITMVVFVRMPSLKVAAVALLGLLLYDVYWVYLSAQHFGKSVMVEVAQQQAHSPVFIAAEAVAAVVPGGDLIPKEWLPLPKVDMPNKLEIPVLQYEPRYGGWIVHMMILGLGDIALPAMLAALALTVDRGLRPGVRAKSTAGESDSRTVVDTTEAASASAGGAPSAELVSIEIEPAQPPADGPKKRGAAAVQAASGCDPHLRGPVPARAPGADDSASSLPQLSVAGTAGSIAGSTAAQPEAPASDAAVDNDFPASLPPQSFCSAVTRALHTLFPLRALRRELWENAHPSLFRTCVVGYAMGLLLTFAVGRATHSAQPALLYLVPCTLFPVLVHAHRMGGSVLAAVWAGLPARPAPHSQLQAVGVRESEVSVAAPATAARAT